MVVNVNVNGCGVKLDTQSVYTLYVQSGGGTASRGGIAVQAHIGSTQLTSFARETVKTTALRACEIGAYDCHLMGMNVDIYDKVQQPVLWPLLCLSQSLSKCNSTQGKPIHLNKFDAYNRNLIAPDHLFTGLVMNFMECCFNLILSAMESPRPELSLIEGLRVAVIQGQRALYCTSSKTMHSLSLSTKYGMLMTIPCSLCWKGMNHLVTSSLADIFPHLSCLVFWPPSMCVDGVDPQTHTPTLYSYNSESTTNFGGCGKKFLRPL